MSKIAISIGHTASGIDRGAIGILDESICTREIGDKVKTYLEQQGHEVVFCRIDRAATVDESLEYRINKANAAGVDLFAEIHLNSGGGVGVETYALKPGGQGEAYAKKIQDALVELGYKNRGVKFANYKVLRDTHASAVLIECGFVDSQADCNRYNADALARKIVKGITGIEPAVVTQTQKEEVDMKQVVLYLGDADIFYGALALSQHLGCPLMRKSDFEAGGYTAEEIHQVGGKAPDRDGTFKDTATKL